MKIKADSVEKYLDAVPADKKEAVRKLWNTIHNHLPEGFEETMQYGMPGFVVPHSRYPAGYHVNPEEPLPFINIAAQKNYIALYHSGIYADDALEEWFTSEYPKFSSRKLDMGKSCIRFKNPDAIPYDLIGKLASKMTVDEWIDRYEHARKK